MKNCRALKNWRRWNRNQLKKHKLLIFQIFLTVAICVLRALPAGYYAVFNPLTELFKILTPGSRCRMRINIY